MNVLTPALLAECRDLAKSVAKILEAYEKIDHELTKKDFDDLIMISEMQKNGLVMLRDYEHPEPLV